MDDLILGFRFAVFFLTGGVKPNELDIRFQKVQGLSAEIGTESLNEGGENIATYHLPKQVGFGNLVLERGMVVGSLLNLELNATLSSFKFAPSNVIVTLLSEDKAPLAAWMFLNAYPVKWSTSDLNAEDEGLVIDTLELAYTQMQVMRV